VELDDLRAFQLFTGRDEEVDLSALTFSDGFVETGKALFDEAPSVEGTRSCGGCHGNAGANNAAGDNRLFATGANKHPNAPACLRAGVPGDGGFGPLPALIEEIVCAKNRAINAIFRGEGFFNTPPLIEAADTPPFFHNNVVATIEQAVEFYTTEPFNRSISGGGNAFILSDTEINQIAALLRALNVLENIRSGNEYNQLALRVRNRNPNASRRLVQLAIAETTDAMEVLSGGPVRLFQSTGVDSLLREARGLEVRALDQNNPGLLERAIATKNRARAQMVQ
jgi:hypothetical protein